MKQINLNQGWQVCHAPLFWDAAYLEDVKGKKEDWLACDLPADVHMPLMEAGIIRDPVKADYCFESEWIERKSWWFRKTFDSRDVDMDAEVVELVLERLDTNAIIFLNGHLLGEHKSVHYPFVKEVKDYIRQGVNEIDVRVTNGLETVSDLQLSELNWAICREQDNGGKDRSDYRRAFVRRPQYTVGWDWGPRVVTCGITGNVLVRSYHKIAIRQLSVCTKEIKEGKALLVADISLENLNMLSTRICDVQVKISLNGEERASAALKDCLITSGDNFISLEIEIKSPELWWPNGYGAQPLYRIACVAECEGSREEYVIPSFGIRTIELDTSRLDQENRKFQFVVNGVPIYCRGGDWIPNDSIYARVTEEKVEKLLKEAVNANFNMIRIWGGGLYESEAFYESCTRKGILLWHDFMFACAAYPDHRTEFVDLVREELDYQTKRLRNYACIALFCGSNEDHWLFNHYDNPRWGVEFKHEKALGIYISNHLAKEIIRKNCPQIPYWNSSPYGGKLPNADTVGDVHRWHNGYMSQKIKERIDAKLYDEVKSKFVSEYGIIGPCCMKTVEEYMDGNPPKREGKVWEMHCNVFEKNTVLAGIEKYYLDNAEDISMEEYLLYGGMVQSYMYEYSLEAMRFKSGCYGAIFWMYNDTWGENGWTIIDYYLRRKISYYGVKRALSHVKLIVRKKEGNVVLVACNDTQKEVDVSGEWGYVSFDGKIRKTEKKTFRLLPASKTVLLRERIGDGDDKAGTMMFLSNTPGIDSAMLRTDEPKNLSYESHVIRVLDETQKNGYTHLKITSDGYVHGVYLKGEPECSDNYFDLLPGEVKEIVVKNENGAKLQFCQIR